MEHVAGEKWFMNVAANSAVSKVFEEWKGKSVAHRVNVNI